MSLHVLPTTNAEVYLTVRELPKACRPCWLVRHNGVTYLAVDPRTSRYEAVRWATEKLHTHELAAYRKAYGVAPIGKPVPDNWLRDDRPTDPVVPPALRLGIRRSLREVM